MMTSVNQITPVAATGITGLDTILGGGLPRDHLYLVEGATGTGKTTLALKFILEGIRRGEPVMYITLSETAEELRLVAASHGWSLDGVQLYELPAAETLPIMEKRYTLFPIAEVERGNILQAVFKEVERIHPARLVLDTLSGLRLLAESPLHHRQQMQGLRQFLSGRVCTSLFVDDVLSNADDYQYPSLVHGIIRLERIIPVYGGVQRRLVITKMRGLAFAESYHDLKITAGDLLVYPHLVAAEHKITFAQEQVSSGIAALDTLLGGGLDRGQSTLLLGPSGTGKSTVAMQYAMAAASRGERSMVCLFEETVETYIQRGVGLGMDIQTQVNAGRMTVKKIDPASLSVGEFAHQICQAVEQEAVRLLVVDSLGGYLHAMPEAKFLSLHLQELLTYLNNRGVVSLLIMVQPGFIGSELRTPVDLSSIADAVLLLRFFEAQGRVRKAISVIKRRGGRHESIIRELQLTSEGVQVGEPLEAFQGILSGIPRYVGEETALLEK